MTDQPTLCTPRLELRPFTLDDAQVVQRLAGDRAIADTTANIPHPYEDGMAEAWISTHPALYEQKIDAVYAMTLADTGELVGAIGLMLNLDNQRGELGYWVGKPYWNHGYCTEAARAMLSFGFNDLELHRIIARHLSRNPASGRVMQKIGMRHEGHLREHVVKWGVFEDIDIYGILGTEYLSMFS